MPKVSNFAIKILGEAKRFDVYYSKNDLFHVKNFPSEVLRINDGLSRHITHNHKTEEDLVKSITKAAQLYNDFKANTRKVIVFSMYATTDLKMNRREAAIGSRSWEGQKKWVNEKLRDMSGDGYGFLIKYQVAFRVENNGVNYLSCEQGEDGEEMGYTFNVNDKASVIDWTEQREKAFEEISKSMEKLVERISNVLLDDKKIEKLLDSGTKLLMS